MRRFRAIIQSNLEPEDKNVLWLTYNSLSYYNNGRWEPLLNSPLIGELEQKIKDRVDKNLAKEIDDIKEGLSDTIKEILSNSIAENNSYLFIYDGAVLVYEDYAKLLEKKVPIYISEGDKLFKVTSYKDASGRVFTFTCVDESLRGEKTLVFDVYTKKYGVVYDRDTKLYTFNSLTSDDTLETYILPMTLKVDGNGKNFLSDDGNYKPIQHIDYNILNVILNG